MDNAVLIAVSGVSDGSMSVGVTDAERLRNRTAFLHAQDILADRTALVRLAYQGDDYHRYFTVTSDFAGDGIIMPSTITADALFTAEKNLALLLPVADCIGAVLYDPVRQVLGLTHLGRHNLEQGGGTRSIDYMASEFGSIPTEVLVWLSPSVGRETYPLHDFDNRSLNEVALEQLAAAGILLNNIQVDPRDTAKDAKFFSHSEFLKGNRSNDGRQAVVTMMRP